MGAGGNTGAVGFGLGFRQLDYKAAFLIMGFTILGSSLLTCLVHIKGHAGMLWGKDAPVDKESGGVLVVPEPGADDKEDGEAEEIDC